jgi:zinc transporter ZupT
MPWGLFISLSVHSILEGIPLGNQIIGTPILDSHHHEAGNSLLLGILFHQLPVAIALMTLLINTKLKLFQSWMVLVAFAVMTPLGVVFGLITEPGTLGLDYNVILAIVVGMFLHISTTIIFETAENHKFNLLKLLAIFVGCALAFVMI